MKQYTIYTISDAYTGLVYYVGATYQPLEKRFYQHFQEMRIEPIADTDMLPVIDVLETVETLTEAQDAEQYWNGQLRAWGFPLQNNRNTNKYHGNTHPLRNVSKKYVRVTITEDEERLIKEAYPYGSLTSAIMVLARVGVKRVKKLGRIPDYF